LTLADVHAALAYFWDHRDEILGQIKEQDEMVEGMKKQIPSKLLERLKTAGNGDALPS
jgi:outer membrane lipopolysaccharide assembly protein LptE/RlpB